MKLLKQAEYMAATGFTLIRQTTFARGWVHIRDSGPLSLACSPNTDAERSKNSSAPRSARTRHFAPCATTGHAAWLLVESATQSSSNRSSDRIFPAGKRNCTATND